MDDIASEFPEAVVAVVFRGRTASGLSTGISTETALTDYGEEGATARVVRVSCDAIAKPAPGDAITVNGEDCHVLGVTQDAVRATYRIAYRDQRPSSEVAAVEFGA